MTCADRVAAALVPVAGAFLAALLIRLGQGAFAWLPALAALGLVAGLLRIWTRSRTHASLYLECLPTGRLVVHVPGQGPAPANLGGGTRLLGPSVFLDVSFASGGRRHRYRRWLTRCDVPAARLRRWSVVLPASGRAACS